MTDAVRSTPDATLRQAQSLSAADQLWLIEKLARDLGAAAVFAEDPPKGEFLFVATHHHSVVEYDELRLSTLDMVALDHGANTILVPGNVQVSKDHRVVQGERALPYRVVGCHSDRLLTFADGKDFGDTLERFQNNPEFDGLTNPATTIIWLRRNIAYEQPVSCESQAPAGDDEGAQPAEGGDEP